MTDTVKTPIEIPAGFYRGHLIRRARKGGQCEYWRGMRNGGHCKKQIAPGDLYLEGDIRTGGSYWAQQRWCRDCMAEEFELAGIPEVPGKETA